MAKALGGYGGIMMHTDEFTGKKILIWGYGREGKSTERFLKNHTAAESVECYEGGIEGIDRAKYDYVFKSPGIVMEEEDPKFTSQTELFLSMFRDRVIGITGTKGKSTTSSMMYYVLNRCLDRKVILLGNIGLPCLDYVDEIDDDTVIVFEMSCHQLAHSKYSPHIAVFLNLFEEHLDYYGSLDKYFAAKRNITKYQTAEDFFFVGNQVPEIETAAKKRIISPAECPNYGLKILGEHNNYNAHFVNTIAREFFGIEQEKLNECYHDFEGLPHRLQYIGSRDGISFYDDSISTIPGASIAALAAVKNAQTVLIGGMDRGISYKELVDYIRLHPEYIYVLMYDSGKRIYDEVSELEYCFYARDLYEATDLARAHTEQGRACLLSPAAASYGYFKNFEERGNAFKEYIGL